MQNAILVTACILVTGFAGWGTLLLISGRKQFNDISFFEKIGLSCLFGFGVISIQMFIMSLFKIGFTKFNILIPWAVAGAGFVLAHKRKQIPVPGIARERDLSPLRGNEIALICLIAFQALYNFFRALIKPIEAYDAVAIYGLKSKMIYLSGTVSGNFFQSLASNFYGAHPDYPLLIPLSETWFYTFIGKFDDLLVKAIFPIFYLSFILVFYAALKRITQSRGFSLLFTFALASVKQFSDYSTISYAELALGAYFAISLIYLYLWMRNRGNSSFLNISLIASLLCLWTKNEGTLLALMILFIFFFYIAMNIRKIGKTEILHFLIYALVVLVTIMSWSAFKNHHALVNENFNLSMVSVKDFIQNLNRIPAIIYEYQKQFFGFKKWNIVWILFIILLLKERETALSGDTKYVTLVFFLFGLGYALIYIFSTVEIRFFTQTTGSRFLLHILPVTIFWMGVVANKGKLIENL
ncbi:MAG: hypothetical protein JSV93_00060 [Candidatus Omnitrophota bacterium]|nr:MAG: hypothetical protein JSV93_00060 [Candidatus Omnitrophota bacterium]